MAPRYKLIYFDLRGIAEPIRYMFAYKDVAYEDFRIADKDWGPAIKAQQPFGLMPVLEIDDFFLTGSVPIARYLAKEFGLAGKNNLEDAMIDMVIDSFQDAVDKLRTWARKTKDEAKKEELKNIWLSEIAPPMVESLNRILEKNGGKYFVGDSLTWADLTIANLTEILEPIIPQIRPDYPLLISHMEQINSIPAIKAWIEKRPKTML